MVEKSLLSMAAFFLNSRLSIALAMMKPQDAVYVGPTEQKPQTESENSMLGVSIVDLSYLWI